MTNTQERINNLEIQLDGLLQDYQRRNIPALEQYEIPAIANIQKQIGQLNEILLQERNGI